MNPADPVVTVMALGLYEANVSPIERAEHLLRETEETFGAARITEMAERLFGLAFAAHLDARYLEVYIRHAFARYGQEALARVQMDRGRG